MSNTTRRGDATHFCPLLDKITIWAACWEIQDVRQGDTDMELCLEQFSLEKAEQVCEKCGWYKVKECFD